MGYDMYRETPTTEEEERATAPLLARIEALRNQMDGVFESLSAFDSAKFDEELKNGESYMTARLKAMNASPDIIDKQREIDQLEEKVSVLDASYFRLNIWGMGSYRTAMLLIGMAYDGEFLQFPELSDFGIGEDEEESFYAWRDENETVDPERAEKYQSFVDTTEAVLSHHAPGAVGIPVQKFTSNDGWLVTEEECSQAVQVWQSFSDNFPELVSNRDLSESEYGQLVALTEGFSRAMNSRDVALQVAKQIVGESDIPDGIKEEIDKIRDVIRSDYWGQWINFLDSCSKHGGFRVW